MESPCPTLVSESPFFYYNPDSKPEHRHHGHFSPHPQLQSYHVPFPQRQSQDLIMPFPSHLLYQRPASSDCHVSTYQSVSYVPESIMTPAASPRSVYPKPAVFVHSDSPYVQPLETDFRNFHCSPATPPFSTSGSSTNSPPSTYGVLSSSVNPAFFPVEGLKGVKQGCEGEVFTEILAGAEWARQGSPPMSPGEHIDSNCINVVPVMSTSSDTFARLQCSSTRPRLRRLNLPISFPLPPARRFHFHLLPPPYRVT